LGVTEKAAELEAMNVRFDVALNNMSQGLCMFDAEQRVVVIFVGSLASMTCSAGQEHGRTDHLAPFLRKLYCRTELGL
jgi:hypothetical protein